MISKGAIKGQEKIPISWMDAIILGLIAGCITWLLWKSAANLEYRWSWQSIPQYIFRFDAKTGIWVPGVLMSGIITTLRISIWATLISLLIGTVMAIGRAGKNTFFKSVGTAYVGLIRNIPILVWLFISYYFIADALLPLMKLERLIHMDKGLMRSTISLLTGPVSDLPLFISGTFALAVYEGAYITEIIRAGIEDIEKGQWEASSALGFNRFQQMRHIILPQAFKTVLPPLAGQMISIIKDSAIVSVISIPELTFQGMELMSATFLTFEIWISILVIYFLICFSCSLGISYIEKKLN
ncbi:amino acid ABC transporter permease [Desulfamplus magnetovallimortis]|uniref:amino acid ABC transporter permease n=1 Tax=Desulfamplus magnetovallimortis TaxID=1246637 RepID=UPI001FED0F63|nr:amino acid ABC transporter permease [Desulfamplus magnetovallimortis]